MYFGIRITETYANKTNVLLWLKKYWDQYFLVMETSGKGVEHYHILVQEDISLQAIRKRPLFLLLPYT